MDGDTISTWLPILISIFALWLSAKQKMEDRLRKQEKKTDEQAMETVKESIKRVHDRLDEVCEGQALTSKELNGKDGVYAQLARLEEKCNTT